MRAGVSVTSTLAVYAGCHTICFLELTTRALKTVMVDVVDKNADVVETTLATELTLGHALFFCELTIGTVYAVIGTERAIVGVDASHTARDAYAGSTSRLVVAS